MLFKVDHESNAELDVNNTKASDTIKYVRNIGLSEIKNALRRMKVGKVVIPKGIPIKLWKSLGDEEIS